jgi:hypothetical protein
MPFQIDNIAIAAEVSNFTIAENAVALRPLRRRVDISAMTAAIVAQAADSAPVVSPAPNGIGQVVAGEDGTEWFVPIAELPTFSATSQTPHVFFDDPGGVWTLLVAIDLVRPVGVAVAARSLPVDSITVTLDAAPVNIVFSSLTEAPPPDDRVVRRVIASAVLPDKERVMTALQTVTAASLSVQAVVHYQTRVANPVSPAGGGHEIPPHIFFPTDVLPVRPRDLQVFRVQPALTGVMGLANLGAMTEAVTNVDVDAQLLHTRMLTGRFQHVQEIIDAQLLQEQVAVLTPQPETHLVSGSAMLTMTDGGRSIPAFFPLSTRSYRRIYARVMPGASADGDPNAAWVSSGAGAWREAITPNEFHILATEYRLALNRETGQPAMNLILVTGPEVDGRVSYRIRARFTVLPWISALRLEALRDAIAETEKLVHPSLSFGGVRTAHFVQSGLLASLGGTVVGPGASTPAALQDVQVDARGFELVLDCTLEFYSLLAEMLSGGSGLGAGIEATVKLGLDGPDAGAQESVDVPVRLRLDRLADPVVSIKAGDPADGATSVEVTIENLSAYPLAVESIGATLLMTTGEPAMVFDTVPATVTPSGLSLAKHGSEGSASVISLASKEPIAFDGVDSVDVFVSDCVLGVGSAEVLRQIHTLSSNGTVSTSIKVRSFILKHSDSLPDGAKDVFGIEVQITSGDSAPLTVFLTRDEPETAVDVAFSFADVLSGMRPDAPKYVVKRRNMIPSGTGPWSEPETIIGREVVVGIVL